MEGVKQAIQEMIDQKFLDKLNLMKLELEKETKVVVEDPIKKPPPKIFSARIKSPPKSPIEIFRDAEFEIEFALDIDNLENIDGANLK